MMCLDFTIDLRCTPASKRVLIIDDNSDAAETMALLLGSLGYNVFTANDGKTGVRMALQYAPDVIFLDITMPTMSGYDTIAILRSNRERKGRLIRCPYRIKR